MAKAKQLPEDQQVDTTTIQGVTDNTPSETDTLSKQPEDQISGDGSLNPSPEPPIAPAEKKPYYQEWKVEIKNKKVEKLKLIRKKVNISEAEAEILNKGIAEGGNTYANMYFLAEQ